MADDTKNRSTYPYGPFAGTKGMIGRLKDGGVPPVIDNSVMRGMSGSARSEVRVAFRFLGLIDSNDVALAPLRALVEAFGTEHWGEVFGDRLVAAYSGMVGEDAEWLDTGTAQQLRDHFKAAGSDSSTLDKSIRFYLAAMNDAGMKLSSYFTKGVTTPRSSSPRKPSTKAAKKTKDSAPKDAEQHGHGKTPPGTTRYPFALPRQREGSVVLPDDTTPDEWSGISAYMLIMLGGKKAK